MADRGADRRPGASGGISARRYLGQCQNDLLRGTDLTFANLKKSTCGYRDEIAVFSVDNAALLDSTAALVPGLWKDDLGEIHTEALGAPLTLPLKSGAAVYGPTVVTDGIQADGTIGKVVQDGALDVVDDDIATLATLCRLFVQRMRSQSSGHGGAGLEQLGGGGGHRKNLPECRSEGVLVYTWRAQMSTTSPPWEKPAGGAYAGWYCGSLETLPAVQDPHVIYISFPQRNFTMLSHEVGHAFGLLHTGAGTTAQIFDPRVSDTEALHQREPHVGHVRGAAIDVCTGSGFPHGFRRALGAVLPWHCTPRRGASASARS